jgi:hypothetical protein
MKYFCIAIGVSGAINDGAIMIDKEKNSGGVNYFIQAN